MTRLITEVASPRRRPGSRFPLANRLKRDPGLRRDDGAIRGGTLEGYMS